MFIVLVYTLTMGYNYKQKARIYAGIAKRSGQITQENCEVCGDSNSEMHHNDYYKLTEVSWLCKFCHTMLHWKERHPDITFAQWIAY